MRRTLRTSASLTGSQFTLDQLAAVNTPFGLLVPVKSALTSPDI
jgi:hypothetical protein